MNSQISMVAETAHAFAVRIRSDSAAQQTGRVPADMFTAAMHTAMKIIAADAYLEVQNEHDFACNVIPLAQTIVDLATHLAPGPYHFAVMPESGQRTSLASTPTRGVSYSYRLADEQSEAEEPQ
jgi:hypothetical protein